MAFGACISKSWKPRGFETEALRAFFTLSFALKACEKGRCGRALGGRAALGDSDQAERAADATRWIR